MATTRLRILLLLAVLLCGTAVSAAKDNKKGDRKEWFKEMREFKHDYFARELELKDDQKERFFAIYDAMDNERRAAGRDVRHAEKELKAKGSKATDAEYQRVNDMRQAVREREAAIDQKYQPQLKAVLTTRQLYRLRDVEQSWRDLVHDHYKKNAKKRK